MKLSVFVYGFPKHIFTGARDFMLNTSKKEPEKKFVDTTRETAEKIAATELVVHRAEHTPTTASLCCFTFFSLVIAGSYRDI